MLEEEEDIQNELKFRLLIISAIIVPKNTYLLFSKLEQARVNELKYLSTNIESVYRYDTIIPGEMSKMLRKSQVDRQAKYFQVNVITFEEKNTIFNEDAELDSLQGLKLLNKIRLLNKQMHNCNLFRKGPKYKRSLIQDDDELVIKSDIKSVYN